MKTRRPKVDPAGELPWLPERARQEFWRPVALPDGRHLVTLQDAANYVANLPTEVLTSDDRWRDVVHDIRMAGAGLFPLLFVNVGLYRAINKTHRR